ncbi:hypothetical protein ABE38_18070 [Brevibacillus agri]|nr:hypothetical protein [Brevibacillus agri]
MTKARKKILYGQTGRMIALKKVHTHARTPSLKFLYDAFYPAFSFPLRPSPWPLTRKETKSAKALWAPNRGGGEKAKHAFSVQL